MNQKKSLEDFKKYLRDEIRKAAQKRQDHPGDLDIESEVMYQVQYKSAALEELEEYLNK